MKIQVVRIINQAACSLDTYLFGRAVPLWPPHSVRTRREAYRKQLA